MNAHAVLNTPNDAAILAGRRRSNAGGHWLSDRRRWTRRRCGPKAACYLLVGRATGADALPAVVVDIGAGGVRLWLREAVPPQEVAEVQFRSVIGPTLRLKVRAAFSARTAQGAFILGVTFTEPLSHEHLRRIL